VMRNALWPVGGGRTPGLRRRGSCPTVCPVEIWFSAGGCLRRGAVTEWWG